VPFSIYGVMMIVAEKFRPASDKYERPPEIMA
jgi:hypothetical protein